MTEKSKEHREALRELVSEHGVKLCFDHRCVYRLLFDTFGTRSPELVSLQFGVREGIAADLSLRSGKSLPSVKQHSQTTASLLGSRDGP